jgi:hypothetical protein
MSSSDYISLKKYRATNGAFVTRDSGNLTQRAKINEIRNIINYDASFNNNHILNYTILPQTWFDVAIVNPTICLHCSKIEGPTATTPIMFKSNTSLDHGGNKFVYKKLDKCCNKEK